MHLFNLNFLAKTLRYLVLFFVLMIYKLKLITGFIYSADYIYKFRIPGIFSMSFSSIVIYRALPSFIIYPTPALPIFTTFIVTRSFHLITPNFITFLGVVEC